MPAPLKRRYMNTGAPKNDVIAPIGSITGAAISLPKVSLISNINAPVSADAGSKYL